MYEFKCQLSSDNRITIPKAITNLLGLKPGDSVSLQLSAPSLTIDSVDTEPGMPSDLEIGFTEWASAADDEAYADL
jgi:AbrB family looped-hinge helix DNA binding protein